MGSFLLFLLFAGIVMVVTNQLTYDRPREIQYRYLPRDPDTRVPQCSVRLLMGDRY